MSSTFRPVLLLMAGRTLGFGVSFFIPMALVRIFDQTEFGTYKQIFLIYATLFGIAQLGMAESLFYFIPSAPRESGRYVLNSIFTLIAAGLACLGIMGLAGPAIAGWMNNVELSKHLVWLGLYLLLTMASAMLEIVMIARKHHFRASLAYAVSELLKAALYLVPVVLLRRLEWLLIGAVAFGLIRFIVTLVYFQREFGAGLRPDITLLKKQLAYALPFEIAVVVEIVHLNLHQYAISFHFDSASFAIYSVGILQIPLVDFLATPASNVMMVSMSEKMREGRNQAVVSIWHDTTRKLSLIFFPLVGLLVVSAREIIVFLFTESYVASVPIFMIWSIAICLSALQIDGVMRVYAATRLLFVLNLVRLVLTAALITWFLSTFHLIGAVLVTIGANCVAKGLGLGMIKRLMRISFAQLLPWRSLGAILAVSAAAMVPAVLAKSAFEASTLSRLLIAGGVYSGSYLILLFVFGLLRSDERLALTAWLLKPAVAAAKKEELEAR